MTVVIKGCSRRKFSVQNDGNDWFVDNLGNPTKPVDFEVFEKYGLPIPDPSDIPAATQEDRIDLFALAKAKAGIE